MPSSLTSYIVEGPAVDDLLDRPPVLPDPVLLKHVILPLVARRNARDVARYLTTAGSHGRPSAGDAAFVVNRLDGMTQIDLDRLFTEPEVTDVARVRRGTADDSDVDLILAMVGGVPDGDPGQRSILADHRRLPRPQSDGPAADLDLKRHATGGVIVHALPCPWLELRFPEVGWLATEEAVPCGAAELVSDALGMVDVA